MLLLPIALPLSSLVPGPTGGCCARMAASRVWVLPECLRFLRDVFYLILSELLLSVKPFALAEIAQILLCFQLDSILK